MSRDASTPWHQRDYTITRAQVRPKRLLDSGLPPNNQYIVTIPPELGGPWFLDGAVFRWQKTSDDEYRLVRIPGAVKPEKSYWSKNELRLLMEGELSNAEVAKVTGRTVSAVAAKRWELTKTGRISKPEREDPYLFKGWAKDNRKGGKGGNTEGAKKGDGEGSSG